MKTFKVIVSCALFACGIGTSIAGPDSVVTFNEIQYHPADGEDVEWVELYNQMAIRTDISGWELRGGVRFSFPEGTVLEPGGSIVVSSVAGVPAGAVGPFDGKLSDGGEEIRLHERHGRMMDGITYGDGERWPGGADGGGFTLAKRLPELASDGPESWTSSTELGGTPGDSNFAANAAPQQRQIFAAGGSWKTFLAADGLPADWAAPGFADSEWSTGIGPFPLSGGGSLLLRKTFAWIGDVTDLQLVFAGEIGGGSSVRFFVNGEAVGERTVGNVAGDWSVLLSGHSVVQGANVLAVEILPGAVDSISFDGGLSAVSGLEFPEEAPANPGPLVINEIHYHPRPVFAQDGVAFESQLGSEWIEILNISQEEIALNGWSIGGGIGYQFQGGESIAPGAFLVLTDADFSGNLSNQGERIVVRDAAGNIVDDVFYHDSGRWPEAADGGGSTLELIDPRSDNANGDAWAASDEAAASEWLEYRYQAVGAEPAGTNNPSNWNEFLLGFLDAGEALIDDISVIEDPGGAGLQLITNGDFEQDLAGQQPKDWRLLGTHKLGKVIANPDGNGNVLHLIATGEQTHTYNTVSTTLAGNRAIDRRADYEIRFRAKWLSGSPQLNTRLYLDRAAKTHILSQPADAGTPGAVNSRIAPGGNAGPVFTNVRHLPAVPVPGQPVIIVGRAYDADGVGDARVMFRFDGGDWQESPMASGEGGNMLATVPGQPDRTVVQFYLKARDGAGVEGTFPKRGAAARALYRVGDDRVADRGVKNNFRLIMLDADATALHERIHVVSNYRWGGTVIYNDRDIFYDVGVRLRSAPYGRQGRPGWNIQFGSDQPFRGVHDTVVIDGALNVPRGDGTGWVMTTAGASINEMLYNVVAKRAGGIAATYDDIVYFAGARRGDNRYAQLKMMRYEDSYLDEVYANGSDGNLYKQELIYYPTTTVTGRPDALKNGYNMVNQVDIRKLGTDKDAYRFNYLLRNNRARDDFAPIIRMCEAFSSTPTLKSDSIGEFIDVDNWMRTLALNALLGVADTYNNGLAHNLVFYSRPDDGKVMIFPWDLDHAFYYSPQSNIFGQGTHRVKVLIDVAANKRRFRGHLLDLCSTAFSNEFLDPWIEHLHDVADQNYVSRFKNWVADRRAFVLQQIESGSPRIEFGLDGESTVEAGEASYTLQGQGWVNVHAIRLVRDDSSRELDVRWLDGQRWEATVPLVAGSNMIKVEAVDYEGNTVGSDEMEVIQTGAAVSAVEGLVVISEIMYHPEDPGDGELAAGFSDSGMFEFVELTNVSDRPVELEGSRFSTGIDFTFPSLILDPDERLVVVSHASAFLTRYGGGARIAGVFTGSLSNGGELIRLLDRAHFAIDEVDYDDRLPWPEEADGRGYSLTRIVSSVGENEEKWRPSVLPQGTPGGSDSEHLANGDDLMTYALGDWPWATFQPADGSNAVRWIQRTAADDAKVIIERSTDLLTWEAASADQITLEGALSDGNGFRDITVSVDAELPIFLRLRIERR
ncbi:MAG: lamin tail domain-containing protein [Verrucomicrobiae bacterium]|nr:lamin tail domain-containing protein [Verrucomicrobiae bacterium]